MTIFLASLFILLFFTFFFFLALVKDELILPYIANPKLSNQIDTILNLSLLSIFVLLSWGMFFLVGCLTL